MRELLPIAFPGAELSRLQYFGAHSLLFCTAPASIRTTVILYGNLAANCPVLSVLRRSQAVGSGPGVSSGAARRRSPHADTLRAPVDFKKRAGIYQGATGIRQKL